MIRTEAGLQSTHDALMKLQLVLWGLYQEKAKHGKGYPIIAEGWVAEIFKLRKEIDDLIGLTDYVAQYGVPPTDEESAATARPPAPAVAGTGTPDRHPTAT
jgi:hypothetical protein